MHTTPLNCLVVEDEPLAATILEDYIGEVPWLHFAGRCPDAWYASEALQQEAVEVLFLDIHLPGMKGLDFLRSLENPPQTILTTAYEDYALEGFDMGVVDYLLKPVDLERFLKAIQKLRLPESPELTNPSARQFHFFNVNKKMVRVWLDEVIYVESLKEYVRIHLTEERSLVTKGQIAEMETLLGLCRIHRSYLVALNSVEAYTAADITASSQTLPIGKQYQEKTMEVLALYSAGTATDLPKQ